MRKTMMVWSACAAAVLPACAAGTAMADGVPVQGAGQQATNTQSAGGWGGAVQALGQAAYNAQSANSAAEALQACASNLALALPILSPGASSGPVSQSNNNGAQSSAGNTNGTTQNASQAFSGWPFVIKI